jgi:hypothetical protein
MPGLHPDIHTLRGRPYEHFKEKKVYLVLGTSKDANNSAHYERRVIYVDPRNPEEWLDRTETEFHELIDLDTGKPPLPGADMRQLRLKPRFELMPVRTRDPNVA